MIFGILTISYIWAEIYNTKYKDRIYNKIGNFDIKRYDLLFYAMKFIYPIWLFFGVMKSPLLYIPVVITHIIPLLKPFDKMFLIKYSLVVPYIRIFLFLTSLLISLL